MSIIYSKNSELNNSMIGKLDTPLKMIIEHESDAMSTQQRAQELKTTRFRKPTRSSSSKFSS